MQEYVKLSAQTGTCAVHVVVLVAVVVVVAAAVVAAAAAAADFGGAKLCAKIAISFGAVRPNT